MKDRAMNLRSDNARSNFRRAAAALAASAGLIASPIALPLALGVAAITALPALAQPSVKAVEPFYVVVTQDQAPLLAGQVETHYRVALLPIGQIMRVDHTVDGWVLCNYPANATAYVRASEVTPSSDGRTVRTNVATRLRAANLESNSAASWSTLLADPLAPLPVGTELRVVNVENRPDGTPGFYRVSAPSQARGYLKAGLYRNATPQEAQDYLNRQAMGTQGSETGSTPAPANNTPIAPNVPVVNPATTPATTPGTNPATNPSTEPAPANAPTNATPTTDPNVNTSLLSDPAVPTPGERAVEPPPPLVIDQSGTITGGPSPDAVPPSTDPLVMSVDSLESAFTEILKQPIRESEVEELIARFEQAMNDLGESNEDQRLKGALRQRAEVLRLRRDYRDSLLALDAGQTEAKAIASRAAQRIDWLRTQGGYAVIGRLVPSTIYDGSSGPLMYRVVAVNTDVPRTLAYVRMDDEFTLPQMVGKVIGVRGQVTIEPSIGTRIVQAESVEAIEVDN